MFQPKKSKIEHLNERSENVINVFTETVNSLKTINEEIDSHKAEKLAEKAKLESHIETLEERSKANTLVINNIQKIFS